MTRIHITDDTITIKRSDLPTISKVHEYDDHDPANGAISVLVDDSREFFHGSPVNDNYEHWLPEQEQYILNDLAALIWAREVDAELGMSKVEKLYADLDALTTGYGDDLREIAKALVENGWSL